MKRTEAAAIALEQMGNLRDLCSTRANLGDALAVMGRWPLAELTLRAALASAARLGLPSTAALARHNLGRVLAQRGKLDEARSVEVAAVEAYVALGNRRMEGGSRIYLAGIEQLAGDLAAAEREARRAVETLSAAPAVRCYALGALARVLLASGRAAEAAEVALEAMRLMDELGAIDAGESLVRLVHAEALAESGDQAGAKRAITAARERLLSRAARIRDRESRDSFLANVAENARTLTLATAWADGG
jgi:tetratricopeptide (TPR) repeat protein